MSKRSYISRYHLIIKKLEDKPYSTFEELSKYIGQQEKNRQLKDEALYIDFSKRTLQRDIKEIKDTIGIDIEYCRTNKGYFISDRSKENKHFQRMMEAFSLFQSLNLAEDISPFIQIENSKPQGLDNLFGIIHGIKNKLQIQFSYKAFYWEKANDIILEPYTLKEFKNRWYIIGKNTWDNRIKTYSLDRLSDLEFKKQKLEFPKNYDAAENFRYCFGIESPNGKEPQNIILSFTPFQGKYIKTLPIHHTQEIVKDNDEELQIKLKLCITYDFIKELLSYGDTMTVVKPKSLVNKIRQVYQDALKQYL